MQATSPDPCRLLSDRPFLASARPQQQERRDSGLPCTIVQKNPGREWIFFAIAAFLLCCSRELRLFMKSRFNPIVLCTKGHVTKCLVHVPVRVHKYNRGLWRITQAKYLVSFHGFKGNILVLMKISNVYRRNCYVIRSTGEIGSGGKEAELDGGRCSPSVEGIATSAVNANVVFLAEFSYQRGDAILIMRW